MNTKFVPMKHKKNLAVRVNAGATRSGRTANQYRIFRTKNDPSLRPLKVECDCRYQAIAFTVTHFFLADERDPSVIPTVSVVH